MKLQALNHYHSALPSIRAMSQDLYFRLLLKTSKIVWIQLWHLKVFPGAINQHCLGTSFTRPAFKTIFKYLLRQGWGTYLLPRAA